MPDNEGFYFTESVWALRPKSLKEFLDAAKPPVWRDVKTGRHSISHSLPCNPKETTNASQDIYGSWI